MVITSRHFDRCGRLRFLRTRRIAHSPGGRGLVDIPINTAGITNAHTFKKMTKADWDTVIHTNLDSVFSMTKQVCEGMVARGWGLTINVSSVNGQKGAFG